jgi:hypothetical protein
MFLIAILLVPAIDAMHTGIRGGELHAVQAVQHGRLTGRMEHVLAESFAVLAGEADAAGSPTVPVTAYSDAAGTKDRVLVYLARYDGDDADADGDPFTGTDEDLLWVRVAMEDTPDAIESLVTR